MQKKNIVLFNPSFEGGGVEKNLLNLAEFLKKKNFNVLVLTNDKVKNLKLKKRFFKYLLCLMTLIFLSFKYDKIIIISFQANLYATLLAKLLNKKIIIRLNQAPVNWGNGTRKFVFKYIMKMADEIIVNSYDFKKEIKKKLNINSTIIYNTINKKNILKISKVKKNIPFFKKKTCNILNIGRLTHQKNQVDILKAVDLLKFVLPIRLIIIGNGVEKTKLTNFIKNKNLGKLVKILPFKKNPYIYIKHADIFTLTSKYEGLPNVLLEAAVLKKTIISYNCKTGPREILSNGKGGVLIKPNYKLLAKEISKFYFSKNANFYKNKTKFLSKSLSLYEENNQLSKYIYLISKL